MVNKFRKITVLFVAFALMLPSLAYSQSSPFGNLDFKEEEELSKRILEEIEFQNWNMEANLQAAQDGYQGMLRALSAEIVAQDAQGFLELRLRQPTNIRKYREQLEEDRVYYEFLDNVNDGTLKGLSDLDHQLAESRLSSAGRKRIQDRFGARSPWDTDASRGLRELADHIETRQQELKNALNEAQDDIERKEFLNDAIRLKTDMLKAVKKRMQLQVQANNLATLKDRTRLLGDKRGRFMTLVTIKLVDDLIKSAEKNPALACHLKLRPCPKPRARREKCESENLWKKIRCKTRREVSKGWRELSDTLESIIEDGLKAVGKTIQGSVNIIEASIKLIENDTESAKRALERAEKKGHEAVVHVGNAAEDTGRLAIDSTLGLAANTTDLVVGAVSGYDGKIKAEYERTRKRLSREIRKGSQKVGTVLEVAIQPENLGKVAFVYVSSLMAGPLGAAFANAMYDKAILGKEMSDKELIRSFAIGAAAGYAAQGAQGMLEGKGIVEASSYLSRSASSISHSLVTDAGNVLYGDSYSWKDLATSLSTGLSTIDIEDDNLLVDAIESSLTEGLKNLAEQSVENDFNLKRIDFELGRIVCISGNG